MHRDVVAVDKGLTPLSLDKENWRKPGVLALTTAGRSCSRLLVMFVLLNFLSNTQALLLYKETNWKEDPQFLWSPILLEYWVPPALRNVILLLNVPDYTDGTEKTYIATGVLLDNSRILTSYNPFKELLTDPKLAEKITVVLNTGAMYSKPPEPTDPHYFYTTQTIVTSIVCAREIAYSSPNEMHVWPDKRHSPLHDLMILRMEEEVGIASISKLNFKETWERENTSWIGQSGDYTNSLISYIARRGDKINYPISICSLVFRNEEELKDYDKIDTTEYGEDDAPLVDCDEWLPRHWGFFICIRNIDNFSALSSGATLFVRKTLFGIGSFAMFKHGIGILVFTDVRPYENLITQTCGDEE